MLPQIPNFSHTGSSTLDTLLILVWMTGALVFTAVAWRSSRRDGTHAAGAESPLANMPKYYLEGPIMKVFESLSDIQKRLHSIERKIDDWGEDGRRRRR